MSCQTIFLLIAAAVLVFVAALLAAWNYVGWWAAVLVFFAGVVITGAVVKRLILKLMMMPFTAKSRALRGAAVEILKVEKVSRPRPRKQHEAVDQTGSTVRAETVETAPGALPPGQEVFDPRAERERNAPAAEPDAPVHEPIIDAPATADGPPRDYWRIELTLTPAAGKQDAAWEPASMVLIPYSTKNSTTSIKNENAILPVDLEIFSPSGTPLNLQITHTGAVRARYTFALPLACEITRWKFRYYFEALGDVRIGE
jgi:hypothetical protein